MERYRRACCRHSRTAWSPPDDHVGLKDSHIVGWPTIADASFSMMPEEFARMVRDVRQAETAIGRVRYGCTRQEEANMRFRRSIFCVRDIRKGEELTRENIRVIRPGYGLEPKYFPEILGQCALQDIKRGMPLRMDLIGSGCGQA